MTIPARRDDLDSEATPLLPGKVKTPVPWGQISLALLVLMAETVSTQYMNPFLNKFIGELGITGGDDRKIGYYSGLMESIVCLMDVFLTWQWSRLSDLIGRRPVILFGLLSLGASSVAIGLSRSFGMLVFSRCIPGLFDGNAGVAMSILGELTDNTNMAQVFAMWPAVVGMATALGSFYGGALANPQERWPHIFRGKFWAMYPYFLPSLVTGSGIFSVFFICAMLLKETLPSKTDKKPQSNRPVIVSPEEPMPADEEQTVSVSTLLTTYSVIIPIANSALYALLDTGSSNLIPLFYSSPIGIGVGLSPAVIGSCWGTFTLVEGFAQALLSPKIIAWLGLKNTLYYTLPWNYLVILSFPILSAVATAQGRTGVVWILMVTQFICILCVDISFTVFNIFVTRAVPNKRSLGSVNGLNQSITSTARPVGALTASLFAFSKQYGIMGGSFVYVVMAILTTILIALSRYLPDLGDNEETGEWASGGASG